VPDIKNRVRAYVVDNFLMSSQANGLGDDTSFLASSILDSTGFLELVSFMEETFGIEIMDEEMLPENFDSLDAIQAYTERKLASRTRTAPSPV
jgi:acyl carrier protein